MALDQCQDLGSDVALEFGKMSLGKPGKGYTGSLLFLTTSFESKMISTFF